MKTEAEIIDEVYENEVYRICTVLRDGLLHLNAGDSKDDPIEVGEEFKARIKIARAIRDRAKKLLEEIDL